MSTTNCCGDYEFWTSHLSEELDEVPIGRSGEKFDEVIDEINEFTGESPGEVIVLQFRYLVGIRNVPSYGPVYWGDSVKNDFFDELRKINNRCPNLGTKDIEQLQMGTLMNMNVGKGCVLIFLDTQHLKDASEPLTLPMEGIFHRDAMSWYGAWPQKKTRRKWPNGQ